jgi:hypothetical protein
VPLATASDSTHPTYCLSTRLMPTSSSTLDQPSTPKIATVWIFAFCVILPVLVGGAIYIVFRDDQILLMQLLRRFGIHRNFKIESPDSLTFLIGSLPDGLWVFSFSVWLRLIWRKFSPWLLLPIFLAIASEIGQLLVLVPGTFDLLDLLAYSAAYLCSFFIRTNHENK